MSVYPVGQGDWWNAMEVGGQVELGLVPFDTFIYDLVEGSRNTVIKCAIATQFRSI